MVSDVQAEWRRYWKLPIAAGLGNSASVVHIYSIGSFIVPLQAEFAWTRTQISAGLTISAGLAAVVGVGVGTLIDRWGPRRVGLIGVTLMCTAYALLGTATGDLANWWMLWAFIGFATAWVKPTVWTSAVASRFDASRGLAIAVTISGSGLAATILPILAAFLTYRFGWRFSMFGIALLWITMILPIVVLFFRGKQDGRSAKTRAKVGFAGDALAGLTLAQGLRSTTFYKLSFAGMVFAFAVTGLIIHLVPVLHDRGVDLITAATIAGLVGISSIAGRFGSGLLLDRFKAERVAIVAFSLPTLTAVLLLSEGGSLALAAGAIILGLSLGSELDVIIYLATRHFGLKRFGTLFGLLMAALSIGTAFGPVTAGAIFDTFHSYEGFILLVIPLVLSAAALVGSLGSPPEFADETATGVRREELPVLDSESR